MKISLVNDIHNEFSIWNPINPDNADVLIMAGDIVPITLLKDPNKGTTHIRFFEKCAELYKHVIYVGGNHEFYHGDLATSFNDAKNYLNHIDNIHLLDNELLELDDVVFFGGVMWTDCNKEDPMTMLQLTQSMNDYHCIKNSAKKSTYGYQDILDPQDTVEEFKRFKRFLIKNLSLYNDKKCVVVTHHSPSFRSIPEQYKYDYEMNGGYASNMDDFILNRPYIKYWVYGHSHSPTEFQIGDTVVLNNARGYVGHERLDDVLDPYLPKTFEV